MIKRIYILCLIGILASSVQAQDFVSLFMDEYPNDSAVNCVTISPRMMEEIYKRNAGRDENMQEVISGLKSMRVLVAAGDGNAYFNKARNVLSKNRGRYESFASGNEDFQVLVRKRNDTVIEMIMMKLMIDNRFLVINLTGDIKTEYILGLAKSFSQEQF